MLAQKWNVKTKKYAPYELPKGCFLFTFNLEDDVACAQCGTTKTFGECFTSKEVHNNIGLGFPVCGGCYDLEINREKNKNV